MSENKVIAFPNAARSPMTGRLLLGSRLRDARIAAGMNQTELAERIGVSRQAVSSYEAGEKSPDPTVFQRIAETLRQPPSFFTTGDPPTFGNAGTRFYRKFGSDTKRRNEACAVLGEWFAQTAKYLDNFVNFPKVNVPRYQTDQPDNSYTFEQVDDIANEVRRQWGLGLGPLSNVLSLIESKGIVVCRYELTGESVEAFSYWNGKRPFVFLATEKEVGVRSRFDLAHELGHLVLHRHISQSELEQKDRLRQIEREANWFAGAFLLPRASFSNEIYAARLDAFVPLKARWKVSIQAMIYRCHTLGIFDDDQTLNLRKQISFRRWRMKEPLDDPRTIPLEQPKLLRKAVDLILQHKVRHPSELVADLKIREELIEEFCALPGGTLRHSNNYTFEPTLK